MGQTIQPRLPSTCVALLPLALAGAAGAGQWTCTLAPESRYSQATQIELPLAGTWIGNYDATTNPTGTQTRPGLFGGSGNVAIPFGAVVKPTAEIVDAVPQGGYGLSFDPLTGALEITGFTADLLGASAGTIGTDIVLTFSTFRTFSPNSTFIGVSNLAVPLGSGSLDVATAVQTGAAVGAATANGDGSWNFALSVPVDVTVAGAAIGQPFASTSPGVLAFAGTIVLEGANVRVTSQATATDSAVVPAPPPISNVAFPLPTILPPGSTANLLMSGTFSEGTVANSSNASIVATGVPALRPGDLNADGAVNGADLGILLAAWGGRGPADLNGDGVVNGADLGIQLANWG
jgi:hypothetical protein